MSTNGTETITTSRLGVAPGRVLQSLSEARAAQASVLARPFGRMTSAFLPGGTRMNAFHDLPLSTINLSRGRHTVARAGTSPATFDSAGWKVSEFPYEAFAAKLAYYGHAQCACPGL